MRPSSTRVLGSASFRKSTAQLRAKAALAATHADAARHASAAAVLDRRRGGYREEWPAAAAADSVVRSNPERRRCRPSKNMSPKGARAATETRDTEATAAAVPHRGATELCI